MQNIDSVKKVSLHISLFMVKSGGDSNMLFGCSFITRTGKLVKGKDSTYRTVLEENLFVPKGP